MTTISPRDLARLLTRACAALQSRSDEDAQHKALIDTLTEASQKLGALGGRWPIEIHIGTIEHSEGVNGYVAVSRSELMEKIAIFCREWWHQIDDDRDPASLDDEAVASAYFESHAEDHLVTDRVDLDVAWPAAPDFPIETGQYCVLGIQHLSFATADVLDQWCSGRSEDRPIPLAETPYGWFVPTRAVDPVTQDEIPADVLAVMQFGRQHGFEHVLIDRDAGTTEELPLFEW